MMFLIIYANCDALILFKKDFSINDLKKISSFGLCQLTAMSSIGTYLSMVQVRCESVSRESVCVCGGRSFG